LNHIDSKSQNIRNLPKSRGKMPILPYYFLPPMSSKQITQHYFVPPMGSKQITQHYFVPAISSKKITTIILLSPVAGEK
jgi:hypothetical protein